MPYGVKGPRLQTRKGVPAKFRGLAPGTQQGLGLGVAGERPPLQQQLALRGPRPGRVLLFLLQELPVPATHNNNTREAGSVGRCLLWRVGIREIIHPANPKVTHFASRRVGMAKPPSTVNVELAPSSLLLPPGPLAAAGS